MSEARPPHILGPDEGELIDVAGDRYRFLATSEETSSGYAIWEAEVPPGGGPPPHRHAREEEGFFVLEGEVTIEVEGRRVVAGPRSFINMPVGCTHGFRNESDRPARLLILVAPGGLERFFREVGQAVSDPEAPMAPYDEAARQLMKERASAYGITILGPSASTGRSPH